MNQMSRNGLDCWLSRVDNIFKMLKIPNNLKYSKLSGKKMLATVRSKFDTFWIDKIKEVKTNNIDNLDHNKLRVYRLLKSSFKTEPYVDIVRNRNQRSSLTRLRISAHNLATEIGRRARPVTPFNQRFCAYCKTDQVSNKSIDTEQHFLLFCDRFENTRKCFFAKISNMNPLFTNLNPEQKFLTLLCPTNPRQTKVVNRFIKFMFEKRALIDGGGTMMEM